MLDRPGIVLALCTVLASAPAGAAGDPQPAAGSSAPGEDRALVQVGAPDSSTGDPGSQVADALVEEMSDAGSTRAGNDRGEWLVAPIPFKSPLIGAGLKLGVARLSPTVSDSGQLRMQTTGIGGMYADGGSWALALGDRHYWGASRRWRTTAGVGTAEARYRLAPDEGLGLLQPAVLQRAEGGILEAAYNVAKYGWIGLGVRAGRTTIGVQQIPPELGDILPSLTYDLFSVEARGEWDTRSDPFFPLGGSLIKASADLSSSDFGRGSDQFQRYSLTYNGYKAVGPRSVVAWRVAAEHVAGRAPFFAQAWFGRGADLRGYTPGRFIGSSLIATQAEWRWQAAGRLGVAVFGGIGKVGQPLPGFEQAGWLPAGGVGLRWQVTRRNRLNFRVDYGRGRDDETLTVSVGEAF